MASYINQYRLWGILGVVFILLSGFITSLDAMIPQPIYKCVGNGTCTNNIDCTNTCSFFGYKKGELPQAELPMLKRSIDIPKRPKSKNIKSEDRPRSGTRKVERRYMK
ncbi:unnamed protein product [Vicia faba]|uniref:Uncharacterized protein n=1 Tax=Vicia faba TaxID=3906 RepID=A0AAV1AVV8_VICFA|nr:unnamed protein product [Vicia faba]